MMVVEPLWPAAGVTVNVRLMPLPPNTRFAAGTSAVLLDVPETMTPAESSSATVNAIGPVLVFASIVRSVMLLMVGAVVH